MNTIASIMFLTSITLLMASMALFTREIQIANTALDVHLSDLETHQEWEEFLKPKRRRIAKPRRKRAKTMAEPKTIIAIDQGTTSSRAILFTEYGEILAQKSAEFPQIFPHDGWVEHDPEAIWSTTVDVTKAMMAEATSRGSTPIAIGITNQRETAIIWDRATGKPIHNAIVWQDGVPLISVAY